MAEQRPRFSFSQAAAEQPERQRFSFAHSGGGTAVATPAAKSKPGLIKSAPVLTKSAYDSLRKALGGGKDLVTGALRGDYKVTGGDYWEGTKKVAGASGNLIAEIVRAPIRSSLSAGASIKEAATGKRQSVGLNETFANLLNEPDQRLESFQTQTKRVKDVVSSMGATDREASTIPPLLVGAMAIVDVLPGGNSYKQIFKKLSKETAEEAIEATLKTSFKGLDDLALREATKELVPATTTKAAKEIVERKFRESAARRQVAKRGARAGGDAVPTGTTVSKAIKSTVDDSAPPGLATLDNPSTTGTRQAAKDVGEQVASSLPKIEQRQVGNFPEFRSADRIAELRTRTRGVRTNEDSLNAARELGYTSDTIRRIPEGGALNAEQKMAVSGVVENERLALEQMEKRLKTLAPDSVEYNTLRSEASRQKVRVYELMAVERGVAAEAGRALQAHRAVVTALERNENKLAKYLSDSKTPSDVKDYIYKKIEGFDGSPNELSKLLRELNQATPLEMFVEFATAAKLWNPTTHAVNFLSSTARMTLRTVEHSISAAFDTILSRITRTQRTRFMSDAVAEIQGQNMGWRHAGHEALKALRDESYAFDTRIIKDFEVRGPAIKGRPGKNELSDRIANSVGKGVRIPFRALGVEDILVRKPSEMGALYTAINRKARMKGLIPGTKAWDEYVGRGIADPVGEHGLKFMEEIQDIADTNLFQESLHPTLKNLSNLRESVPALKFVVPFFRTIVNLQKQALEFSLIAPILPSVRKSLRGGGGARSDVLARMTIGTAATLPLVQHAMEGNITLAAPRNPAERDAFYAEGKQPYAIRMGDTWYSYNRFSPFSEWFITAGALAEAYQNEDNKSATEITSHVFFSMTQNFFDKSFATGLNDLLEALNDPERAGNWVQNFVTGATVPNFIPLWARVADPVIRETDNLRDAYISKVPYLSKTLDPKRDVFGEPISRHGNAIAKIISPVIPSPVEVDMVREELSSIGYQMGFPGKTAGGFDMDDETYRIYQAVSGRVVYNSLSQLIQNPEYQSLNARQKELAVGQIVRDARELVKANVAQEQLIMQALKNELKNQGYSNKQAEDLAVRAYEIIKTEQANSPQKSR